MSTWDEPYWGGQPALGDEGDTVEELSIEDLLTPEDLIALGEFSPRTLADLVGDDELAAILDDEEDDAILALLAGDDPDGDEDPEDDDDRY